MSSNIRVLRICQHCGNEFTAKTTVTNYCGDDCAKRAYKARKRAEKVATSNLETLQIIARPIEELKAKEYLTAQDVAKLLGCSVRSVYYYIESGTIKATNLGQRLTRVKRSELDKLFEN
jgi:excisionase family DNA binding protein